MRTRALALALCTMAGGCDLSGAEDRPRNLLLVCVDTLRADQLGAYGAEPSLTPRLDELAGRGALFERAHASASWTLPSVASLFTSVYPSTHGCWTFENRLPDALLTLAEIFGAAGFDTQGIASHDFFQERYGLQQGFAGFDDELAHRRGEAGWRESTSPEVSARAVRWLEERSRSGERRPWLLFLHYFDPHVPYVDHEARPGEGRALEFERYQSEIAFTDRHVGGVLDALRAGGFERETAVLFFSDHGESFEEHPGIRRHSYSLYETELRVPLVLCAPGIAAQRVGAPVRAVDVLPTLLELFGLRAERAQPFAGTSLLPLLFATPAPPAGGEGREEPELLAEIRLKDGHHANALVRGRWKLIEDVSNARFLLFDLEEDPLERRDLASEQPGRVAELARALRERIEEAARHGAALPPSASVTHTEEDLRHLEDLGYGGGEGAPEPPPDREGSGG